MLPVLASSIILHPTLVGWVSSRLILLERLPFTIKLELGGSANQPGVAKG